MPSASLPVSSVDTGAEVRDQLSQRTREILERPAPTISAEEAAFDKQVVTACRYAMNLLATRMRSEAEVRARLIEREYASEVVDEAMHRLNRAELFDDEAFAREWVRQRRARKGLADQALRSELEERGVNSVLIDQALRADADHEDARSDEEQRCRELVRQQLRWQTRTMRDSQRGVGDGWGSSAHWERVARRLDAYLARRGYDGGMAVHVISTEIRAFTSDHEHHAP